MYDGPSSTTRRVRARLPSANAPRIKMAPSSKLARREEFTNSATASAPLLPFLAIRGYLCFRCLEHKEKLSLCKGCQRAVYCSKECQITDWRLVHRHHCKLLRCINERQLTEDHDSRSWEAWTEKLVSPVSLHTTIPCASSTSERLFSRVLWPGPSSYEDEQLKAAVMSILGAFRCAKALYTPSK